MGFLVILPFRGVLLLGYLVAIVALVIGAVGVVIRPSDGEFRIASSGPVTDKTQAVVA